jgi:hypothetical protein
MASAAEGGARGDSCAPAKSWQSPSSIRICGWEIQAAARQIRKSPLAGALAHLAERGDSLGTSMCLALRAASPCRTAILPFCRTWGSHRITPLRQIRKSPLAGALRIWRRGGDSNPRYAINVCLISSQVHSTTLPPLRWFPGRGQGENDTGRTCCGQAGRPFHDPICTENSRLGIPALPGVRFPGMIPYTRVRIFPSFTTRAS